MKPTIENLSNLEKKMIFQISPEEVLKAFETSYKQIQRNAKVDGFRKGKAPLNIIKSLYKDSVYSSATQKLIEDNFYNALSEAQMNPINNPHLNIEKELEEGQPFHFSLTFEVHPEIDLKKYTNLSVQKEILSIDPTHLDKTLENIQKNNSIEVPITENRPAQNGDIAYIDFEGFVDGKPLNNGSGANHPLELGSKSFIEGFEESIVGMSISETKTAHLKFPENYHASDLSNKPVEFKITLKELKRKDYPNLDDELAKKAGLANLEALKKAIQEEKTASEEKRIQDEFKSRLLNELVKNNPIDVPNTLVARQKEIIIQDTKERMSQMRMTNEQLNEYVQKWDADFNKSALFAVHSSYLLNKIAEKENLLATNDDLEKRIQSYIQQTGIEEARIRAIYNEPENRKRLLNVLTEDKVISFLTEKAEIKELDKSKLTPLE